MPKVTAYYDHLYLVALNEEKTGSHRVTERDASGRPGTISFSGNFPTADPEQTYSTLVLDEDKWTQWFGKRKRLENMETAAVAAETLVKTYVNIYYGCPLCTFREKDLAIAKAHIHEHVNKFVQQFRIEAVDEKEVTKNGDSIEMGSVPSANA